MGFLLLDVFVEVSNLISLNIWQTPLYLFVKLVWRDKFGTEIISVHELTDVSACKCKNSYKNIYKKA